MARLYPPDFCALEEMAYLVSLTPEEFSALVNQRVIPAPVVLAQKEVWSRKKVLDALEALGEDRKRRQAAAAVCSSGMPNVFTAESLAEYWGCSSKNIRNLVARGELRHFKLGGKLLRISKEHVETYEREHSI